MATTNGGDRTHSGRARDSTSPLGGIAYDWRALRLHEYVDSPVDREVRRFLVAYERLTDDDRAEGRSAMSVDEFETLVAFAQRSVVASVRASNPAAVSEGLFALTAIDQQRVDYRDVT